MARNAVVQNVNRKTKERKERIRKTARVINLKAELRARVTLKGTPKGTRKIKVKGKIKRPNRLGNVLQREKKRILLQKVIYLNTIKLK